MADETTTKTTETTETIDYKAKFEELEGKYSNLKTSFDKTSSENAEYKRQARERMTEEDKFKAEREEEKQRYAELEKRLALRDYADELDDYADKNAVSEICQLLADGKIKEALSKQKALRVKERAELEKKIKAELLKENPQPNAQSSGGGYKSASDIMAIKDSQERQKAIAENSHLFVK